MDHKTASVRNSLKVIAAGVGMLLFVAVLYVASAGPALRWTSRKRWKQVFAPVDHVARTRGPVGRGLTKYLAYWDPWIEVGGTGSIEEFSWPPPDDADDVRMPVRDDLIATPTSEPDWTVADD